MEGNTDKAQAENRLDAVLNESTRDKLRQQEQRCEQYGFYGAIAGSTAYLASRFYRAHALIKYQSVKDRPDMTKEAELWADIANVTPHQLARAGRMVRRFHAQGIAAITLAPIMWVAFRWSAG